MRKRLISILALLLIAVSGAWAEDGAFTLGVGTNEHGTVTFKVGENTVTAADEGDVVTVTITPNTGWVVKQPSGQWYAAVAGSRRTGLDLLDAVTLTPAGENTWTFTMQRANVEISSTYKKLLTNADITIEDIVAPTYTGQAHEPEVTVKDGSSVLVKDVDYTVSYANNTAAALSTAAEKAPTVTITAVATSENYAGKTSKTFTIEKKALEDGFIAAIDPQIYTGQAQTPEPVLTYNNMTLVKTSDYSVAYADNVNPGTATVTVTAAADCNYSGTASKTFTIQKKEVEAGFIAAMETVTYSGKAYTPDPALTFNDMTLVKGTDYLIGYTNNVNAGTATVTVTGIGFYSGRASKTFTIQKKALTVTADDKEVTYGDDAPEYTVTYDGFVNGETASVLGGTLALDCSYVKNESGAGTYVIRPSGLTSNNYAITNHTGKLTVGKKSLKDEFVAAVDDVTYSGQAQKPAPVVTFNGMTLAANTDYSVTYANNKNAGTATMTITGKGDYSGTVTREFAIRKAALTVTAEDKSVSFGANAPRYTATYAGFVNSESMGVLGGTLTFDCPYVKGQSGAGEYAITPGGLTSSNYDITFADGKLTVGQKSLAANSIATVEAQAYTGQALEPEVTVKDGTSVLVKDVDYTVAYEDNVNAGIATAKVTVTGKGNYSGTASKTFTITPAVLTAVTLAETEIIYNHQEQEVRVAAVSAGTLEVPADGYDVTGSKATNVGTYTVTVSGKGNFKGSVTAQFSIVADDANTFEVTVDPQESVYTGQAIEPAVTVKDGETVLVEGTDYTLAFTNNVNAGTATVTATGKGNYSGTKTATFTIDKADVTVTAPAAKEGLVYNGEAQALIAAGQADGGEMQYSLDGENYATTLPQGTDAREYTVYYKVVADANHNDAASQAVKVTVAPAGLTAATLAETNFVYNQQEQTVEVSGVSAGTIMVASDGYDVTGNKATNVGTYTVTVSGKGNFTGSVTAQFSIVADDANTFVLTVDPETFVYDGTEKTPAVTVKDGNATLAEGTDYTLAFTNNVNAGTATVTATGKGNYSGTKTATFTIDKADITVTAPAAKEGLVYTAQAQTLIAAGQADGGEMQYSLDNVNFSTTLPQGTDAKEYTVSYKVIGDANHKDVASQAVKVTVAPAGLTDLTLAQTELTYNQQEQSVGVSSVKAGELAVTSDGYDVTGNKATEVGTYTVTVSGKGNFKGEVTAQFSIVPAGADAQFTLTLDPQSFVYDGTEKTPAVTVKDGETVLVEGTDYTLAFTNNVNAGTATVTATGKGNYSGTKTATFTIDKADVTVTAPTPLLGILYTGEAQTLIVAGSAVGGEMQYSLDGENYTAELPTGIEAKEYTVYYKVIGDANHNDTEAQTITVTIAEPEPETIPVMTEDDPVSTVDGETFYHLGLDEQTTEQVSALVDAEDSGEFLSNVGMSSNAQKRLVPTETGLKVIKGDNVRMMLKGMKAEHIITIRFSGKIRMLKGSLALKAGAARRAIGEEMELVDNQGYSITEDGDVIIELETAESPVEIHKITVTKDETTGLSEELIVKSEEFATATWYDLKGRKLNGMPTKKGMYILNGKKVVIK